MPTYERSILFKNDYKSLTAEERLTFKAAVREMVAALKDGAPYPKRLRVRANNRGGAGIFEMSFGHDLRATFSYGTPIHPGEAHIEWRRVGHHDIYLNP